ncbi:hypothetical protein E3E14_29585 [Streptomyces sp. ICN441]|uniref:DUF7144 domain-containing protein n=1 Tax=Streptomyces tirandamycinicus TaxID=2174846 RepID=A0A2S1SPA6_9ACTN|nr:MULTISPECIES: hypothetical protein [Streptomyces]AWI28212.1 hypothetical protein DDW44_04940 [Streptomyces tirandamycinicus]MCY0979927.1 hypothetical protein [Streptomyces tirandamycinicus]NNJ02841.1 hypothetical protein [Streptomyces sp. PKU-MA01144]TFE38336.1 hypothetical protein E3E14_29585 [Streptomyces sp. ICN441]
MSQHTARSASGTGPDTGWAAGGTLFAGVLMLVIGVISILEGIAGIVEDEVYLRVGGYVFSWNLTAWGWIHLVLGVLVAVTGWGILRGMEWSRYLGVALASLNIIVQFLFLPYQPVWALFSMAVSVFVIWALVSTESHRPA